MVHPRITTPSMHLELQQTLDENGDPPCRYHSARCGNRYPTVYITGCLGLVEGAAPGKKSNRVFCSIIAFPRRMVIDLFIYTKYMFEK